MGELIEKYTEKNIATNKTSELLVYMKKHKWLYLMLIPGFLYLFIFNYIPMFGIIIAFKDFNMVKGIFESDWIGFENFEYLFTSKDFYLIFRNSLLFSFYRLVWSFPVPIFLAIILNEIGNMRFKKLSQTILYLPYFISWVVLAGIIISFLSPTEGLVNYIISLFGGEPIAFLQKPEYFRSIIIIAEIWKGAGWGTIIYLASIAGIDQDIYEAAIIDGASRIQRIIHITIPGISSTIIVMLIMRMGSVLKNGFEEIFLLYNPMVYDVADVFETYTYRIGIQGGRFSYSTAVGIFQSVVGFIMITIANKLAKRFGESSLY